ncbi:hypothetical protein PG993_006155 [Apiospora rasikravindrae]|uniref:Uncharacterized protein n=1 Tax=Apiospora rasikravindrae TaxID=990691 RepID=A0ABR1T5C7_9PEZI
MANIEKHRGHDDPKTASGWDSLDGHVDTLKEKYEKERKHGDARHHHRTNNQGSRVEGINRVLATNVPGNQARNEKSPL